MLTALLLLGLGVARADCPDLGSATATAVEALVSGRLEAAQASLGQAEAALSCGDPPDREALARLWLAEGAVASVAGQPEDAVEDWQAAARLQPDLWEPRYGEALKADRDAAVAAMGQGGGTIRVDPLPEKTRVLIDGAEAPDPAPAVEGLHVVQLARREVLYGKVVLLGADETLLVHPELPPPPDKKPIGGRIATLAGGALGVGAGAGLLVLASHQDAPMDAALAAWRGGARSTADASAEVDHHWALQRAEGGAGYALIGLGVVGIGVGVVW